MKYNHLKTAVNKTTRIPATGRRKAVRREADRKKIPETIDIMRSVVISPLGSDPERDEIVKDGWHSGERYLFRRQK